VQTRSARTIFSLTGFKLLGFWVLRTSFLLVNIRANLVKKYIKKEESLYYLPVANAS
jgi:hypothetical protein